MVDYGYQGYQEPPPPQSSFMDRIIGVVTFKAPIYREIANDSQATGQAAIILVATSIITALLVGLIQGTSLVATLQSDPELQAALFQAGVDPATVAGVGGLGFAVCLVIVSPISALISWYIGSWLTALVARSFFSGEVSTDAMLRIYGYTSIFSLLGAIPCVGLIAAILSIVGNVIGLREAANFDTGKAVLTYITMIIIYIVIAFLIVGCIFGGLFALASAAGGN